MSRSAKAPVKGATRYYLHGVTDAENPLASASLAAVERIVVGNLAALVQPVSDVDLAPRRRRARVGSMEWINHTAYAHKTVLNAAMEGGPVVQAHLSPLFSSREAVIRHLAEGAETLTQALELLRSPAKPAVPIRRSARSLFAVQNRFLGNVTMGLRVCLPAKGASPASLVTTVAFGLRRIHALTASPSHREERIHAGQGEIVFEGSYVIPRSEVGSFWLAVEEMRRRAPCAEVSGHGAWNASSYAPPLRPRAAAPVAKAA